MHGVGAVSVGQSVASVQAGPGAVATWGATGGAAASVDQRPILNPAQHIDPALGLVVTQFYNEAGDVTQIYPSAQAMRHYAVYGVGTSGGSAGDDHTPAVSGNGATVLTVGSG
ncbi:hypothetical protein AA103196_3071 [Ameyamaea chiangmaiensis NBRC 103196]|uniref:Uncharacterized protein n=2 Tax=Ameyamaea chiangmaiensis TaxID=442969 RepID=A0A850P4F1_9PROT|nr:hypothetical protein [Ameyamaea chiangmaiensis]NVN39517.1 hypothetical protein [Ameyamaea chiangmaiensis]GBQ72469.1 hypothetical protein AA103196_3071 [Ameyamaea chiangmaiensis NBRC 103196]